MVVDPMDEARFEEALRRIDAANARDLNREVWEGVEHPKELLYGRRMTEWLERLEPDASEALRLAVRAQHIRRWELPRDLYPRDRAGYHRWRTELYGRHADHADEILRGLSYDDHMIQRVRDLLMKKRLKSDPEAQTLEDVACLVFLEFYFAEFAPQYDEAKVVTILRRTWKKMSERGHAAALRLEMPAEARRLVEKALAGDEA